MRKLDANGIEIAGVIPRIYTQAQWPPSSSYQGALAVLADSAYGGWSAYTWLLDNLSGDASYPWRPYNGNTPASAWLEYVHDAINNAPNGWVQEGSFQVPLAGTWSFDVGIGGSTVQQGVAAQIQAAISTGNTAAPSGTTIATAASSSSGLGALGAHALAQTFVATKGQTLYVHRYGSANGEGGLVIVRMRPVKVAHA